MVTPTSPPKPLGSLVASARRITTESIERKRIKAEGWQADAWDMFDLVGEQRFLSTTLANRVSQARFFVGRLPDALTNEPEEVITAEETAPGETDVNIEDTADQASDPTDHATIEEETEGIPADVVLKVLETFGGSPSGRAQIMSRLALNLFIAGDGWVVGIPREYLESDEDVDTRAADYVPPSVENDDIALEDLEWRMLSVAEVKTTNANMVALQMDDETTVEVSPDDIYLIRVWRSHPNKAWEADSPTRSSLPVLRELVGLTMHVSAQVDSRLAGAGILIVPQSAQEAIRIAAGLNASPTADDQEDPFTDALIKAMVTPISDRSNASAMVPLVVTAPDESVSNFKHISFSTPLDKEARQLRDEAIRRLALGQDAPPELLLGTGGMNHWGAWLVQEDVVTTHIAPTLALICDALTTQYLWPVLEALDYPRDLVRQYVIWFDVEHMIIRPNRSADAEKLFAAGAISASAYRDAAGFDDSDAPSAEIDAAQEAVSAEAKSEEELKKQAGLKAIDLAIANPELVIKPGLQSIAQQVYDVLTGSFSEEDDQATRDAAIKAQETVIPPAKDEPAEDDSTGAVPDTSTDDAVPTGLAVELEALSAAPAKKRLWGVYEEVSR